MYWRAVAPGEWSAFLRSFGLRHESWLVRLRSTAPAAAVPVECDDEDYAPLRELRLERDGDGEDGEIVVRIGERDEPCELRFAGPRAMQVELSGEGVERGLWIAGRDGELSLWFRTVIAPELVDGPPL